MILAMGAGFVLESRNIPRIILALPVICALSLYPGACHYDLLHGHHGTGLSAQRKNGVYETITLYYGE